MVMSWARCIGIGLALGIVLGVAIRGYALALVIAVLSGAAMGFVQKRRDCVEQN